MLPEDAQIMYNAGDVAWIHPENVADFNPLFERLGLSPTQTIQLAPTGPEMELPTQSSVEELFVKYLDMLGTPRRYFFEQMSLFAADEEEVGSFQVVVYSCAHG